MMKIHSIFVKYYSAELQYKDKIVEIVNDLHKLINKKEYKIIAELPSKTGIHIISNPFNIELFNDKLTKELNIHINVQKNSPTILFCL